jgi:hypothetical protein
MLDRALILNRALIIDAPAQPQEHTLPVVCAIQELGLGKTKGPGKTEHKSGIGKRARETKKRGRERQ